MADKEEEKKEEKKVEVPLKILTDMQEQMAEMERKLEDEAGKRAGLEELLAKSTDVSATGEPKLREKKSFEPKFRTVRLRKYPIAGDDTNLGYVIGWTNKGAYQEVDRTGVSPQIVDYIDIVFLGKERDEKTKNIKAEKVKLLDFMNKGDQVHCKILETKREDNIKVPTGEEIDVTVFDPAHGLVQTGDKIDGYITYSEIKYKVQIPGQAEGVWVDSTYCNR